MTKEERKEKRIERKMINGQLCDVYYDENGEVDLIHSVRNIEHMKWGEEMLCK